MANHSAAPGSRSSLPRVHSLPCFPSSVTAQTLRELGLDLKEKVAHSIYNFQNEEVERRALWEENMKLIQLHNKEYHQGKNTFTMAMNAFGDQVSVTWI